MASKLKPGDSIASIMFNGLLRKVVLGYDGHHIILNPPVPQNPILRTWESQKMWIQMRIPKDVDPNELYNLIVDGMRKRNYLGSVNARMIFAKTNEHITLYNLSQMQQFEQRDLQFYSKIPGKDTADKEIQREIDDFVAKNQYPRNLFVLEGDTFFSKSFTNLKGEGKYRVLVCFRAGATKLETLNDAVDDSWVYRDLLGLPYEPEPEKKIPGKDTADKEIQREIDDFVAKNQYPRNLFVLEGDTFFSKSFTNLKGEGKYRVLVCFRAGATKLETLNDAVDDSWVYRDLLGLPYEPEPEKKIQNKRTGKRKKGHEKEPEKFEQNQCRS